MVGFKDSSFVFTDPIRYFKENDPYYWEVDNIPLKQLQENCLWLKDQIAANPAADGIDRRELNELLPYSDGTNNIVKVKPGRFTARINDAYNKTPLQKLSMLTGEELGQFETYSNPSGVELAQAFLNRFQSTVTTNALSLNGLIERVLSWPVFNEDLVGTTQIVNTLPSIITVNTASKWPLLSNNDFFANIIQSYGAAYELPRISAEFVKQFRGVARTAVVDVPEELTIQIPNFNQQDFFTLDAAGAKTVIENATTRIDLLFVYSKPIDVSSTTLQKWSGGQPVTITKPVLGLVRGAGVGISRSNFSLSPARDSVGNTQIMADHKDALVTTNGFQASNVHGSFPSPDDLMNIAPIISERLSETDPQLIGQSILPLAYIVVDKNANVNSLGNVVITENNIIDIRPFFRTTELTYGERAGLAAAIPAPSLANPVTTQFTLDRESSRLKGYIDTQITNLTQTVGGINTTFTVCRPVAGGTIWGGLSYGPEGAINQILTSVGTTENLFTDATIPTLPDWDLADWWTSEPPSDTAARGERRADRINYSFYGPTVGNAQTDIFKDRYLHSWVKKKININRNSVPWMVDYEVRLGFKNCFPLGRETYSRGAGTNSSPYTFTTKLTDGIFYEKYETYFIVYVYLPYFYGSFTNGTALNPRENRSVDTRPIVAYSQRFPYPTANNGYDVLKSNLSNLDWDTHRNKNPYFTTCTYPTVSFDVIGYTANTYNGRLAQDSTPTIILR